MGKFEKGKAFALKHIAQFGYEKAQRSIDLVINANPGRPVDDPYVMGLRAGLAES